MSRKTQKKASKNRDANWRWGALTLALIALVALLRLAINALDLVPIHFDEGQYWAYGQELAAGHFSKPPLVGWLIQFTTSLGGDTSFALRLGSIVCHGLIAFLLFLCGTWLWDGRTGFWAAAGYTAAPGVTASAMIMSTDPVMMTGWALALYAWIRAAEGGARIWWAVLGGALGLAMLAKYTALAFAAGAVGYALFSARGRDVAGVLTAVVVGLLVSLRTSPGTLPTTLPPSRTLPKMLALGNGFQSRQVGRVSRRSDRRDRTDLVCGDSDCPVGLARLGR